MSTQVKRLGTYERAILSTIATHYDGLSWFELQTDGMGDKDKQVLSDTLTFLRESGYIVGQQGSMQWLITDTGRFALKR